MNDLLAQLEEHINKPQSEYYTVYKDLTTTKRCLSEYYGFPITLIQDKSLKEVVLFIQEHTINSTYKLKLELIDENVLRMTPITP